MDFDAVLQSAIGPVIFWCWSDAGFRSRVP